MTPDKTGKDLAQFNVKNAVYNIDGTSEVKPLTWMNTFTKNRNVNVTALYGDGEVQVSLYADTTISGAIGTTARDEEFEKAIGLAVALADSSLGEVAVNSVKKINFGFETEIVAKKRGYLTYRLALRAKALRRRRKTLRKAPSTTIIQDTA